MTVLTPANQLTLLRMLLIPAFVILVIYGEFGWALGVFVTAGITDGLDGLIARLTDQKTSIGAWLDPMADKLLLVTTFIVLTWPGLGLANRYSSSPDRRATLETLREWPICSPTSSP